MNATKDETEYLPKWLQKWPSDKSYEDPLGDIFLSAPVVASAQGDVPALRFLNCKIKDMLKVQEFAGAHDGASLMYIAAKSGQVAALDYMLENGGRAWINEKQRDGKSPLFAALYRAPSLDCAKLLILQGASIGVREEHFAAVNWLPSDPDRQDDLKEWCQRMISGHHQHRHVIKCPIETFQTLLDALENTPKDERLDEFMDDEEHREHIERRKAQIKSKAMAFLSNEKWSLLYGESGAIGEDTSVGGVDDAMGDRNREQYKYLLDNIESQQKELEKLQNELDEAKKQHEQYLQDQIESQQKELEKLENELDEAKKQKCDDNDEVEVISGASSSKRKRVTRSSVEPAKVKVEDPLNGSIRCPHPDCIPANWGIVVSTRGCNVVTCRNHGRYYFCYHCKKECPDGDMSSCQCPKRNNMQARVLAQNQRNHLSKENPIDLH